MTAAPVVEVADLVKTYGDMPAVDGVSFTVQAGEVYGLLGENGAGKTTTVEILEGFRTRTSGSVSVLGGDPGVADRALRDRIGIVLQSTGVERVLTVGEVLELYGSCYRRSRTVAECVDLVGLEDTVGKRCDRLSGGQRRRLDLALGIIGYPDLLFLDEPTTGFDPAARRGAWELIRSLSAGGTTVLLTSHYLDEVEQLADRVGVLRRGRLIAEGSPAALDGGDGRHDGAVHVARRCRARRRRRAAERRRGRRRRRLRRRRHDADSDGDAAHPHGLGAPTRPRARRLDCPAPIAGGPVPRPGGRQR